MKKSISVLVPVYNGAGAFRALIESLAATYPAPREGLHFVFVDDGSPDPAMADVYQSPFFSRPDVTLHKRAHNLGFVRTVNEAAERAPSGSDLVLLNSDTQVWTEVFETLQRVASAHPRAASVTPLTNNGSIASLLDWPAGSEECLADPRALAQTVRDRNLATPVVPAPAGVGFCLFIPRWAWDLVGGFSEAFGRGYGEEADWSRRAVQMGLIHLITTEAYVHHSGTQSFATEEKRELLERNARLLESRNPGFHEEVFAYVQRDPLKAERLVLLTSWARMSSGHFLLTLHKDPEGGNGGTEAHVRRLTTRLLEAGKAVSVLYPKSDAAIGLRLAYGDRVLFDGAFHASSLPSLLPALPIDVLHVHHTIGWPDDLLDLLFGLPVGRRLFTAHDYFSLCPSINLLRPRRGFCEGEPDPMSCNDCLKRELGLETVRMESYRAVTQARLEACDEVLFPSQAAADVSERALGDGFRRIHSRVLGHDLSYLSVGEQAGYFQRGRIAFLGNFAVHKGASLLIDAFPDLKRQGFSPEIWGGWDHSNREGLPGDIPVFAFKTSEELEGLFRDRSPELIALPSVWGETFSFVLFESLFLSSGAPVVVGPYGNPARVVRESNLGVVMEDVTPAALVSACSAARKKRAAYSDAVRDFVRNGPATDSFERYLAACFPTRSLRPTPLPHGLSRLDALALERERLLAERSAHELKAALKLRSLLVRYPRARGALMGSLKLGWRSLAALKSKLRAGTT